MTSAAAVTRSEVPEAFNEVASRYDLMAALNPGYHAHLRSSASALVESLTASLPDQQDVTSRLGPHARLRVMDLGCGSGASTHALVKALDAAPVGYELVGVDASSGMLAAAAGKPWPSQVRFVQARAERLGDLADPTEGEGWDGIFAAYLVRNVGRRDELLDGLYRLLRPGGVLVVHEYSVAGNPRAAAVWTAVCRGVIVPLGWVTSRRTRLYSYLWRSVLDFDSTAEVMDRFLRAGFGDVRTRSVPGWQRGILHTFHARRPR